MKYTKKYIINITIIFAIISCSSAGSSSGTYNNTPIEKPIKKPIIKEKRKEIEAILTNEKEKTKLPIIKEKVKKSYENSINVFDKGIDSIKYVEDNKTKINLDKIASKENIWKTRENKVHIFEAGYSGKVEKHAKSVLNSFLDKNRNTIFEKNEEMENPDVTIQGESQLAREKEGIINMSYGLIKFNDNFWTLNRLTSNKPQVFRTGLTLSNAFYKYYINSQNGNYEGEDNKQLRIKSIGNTSDSDYNISSYWLGSDDLHTFQIAPSEVQKAMRSEQILVKNIINPQSTLAFLRDRGILYSDEKLLYTNKKLYTDGEKKYVFGKHIYTVNHKNGLKTKIYEQQSENDYESNAQVKPMLMRAYSISESGYLYDPIQIGYNSGSSFSAPRVARTAYEIKKIFPWMSYNQIKQTILTTSDNGDDYLNDYVGWGILNSKKAKRGPSDFNAGLIEEQKFFKAWLDATRDKKGNYFFYANLEAGDKSEFSNNIGSGLKGDGKTQEYKVVEIKAKSLKTNGIETFFYKIPKVLDSERLFYSNVKTAGLRKDGKGELILSGKQEYSNDTEILDGTLTLKNDSKSKYKVFSGAKFKLENKDFYKNLEDKGLDLTEQYLNSKLRLKINAIEESYNMRKDKKLVGINHEKPKYTYNTKFLNDIKFDVKKFIGELTVKKSILNQKFLKNSNRKYWDNQYGPPKNPEKLGYYNDYFLLTKEKMEKLFKENKSININTEKIINEKLKNIFLVKNENGFEVLKNLVQEIKEKDGKIDISLDEKAKKILESFKNIGKIDKKIIIENDIENDGVIEIDTNVEAENYIGSKNSTLKITKNGSLNVKNFKHTGKIYVENVEIKDGKTDKIKATHIDLEEEKLMKEILKSDKVSREDFEYINFKDNSNGFYKSLKDLSEAEKRNLPSYITNFKNFSDGFFEKYITDKVVRSINEEKSESKQNSQSNIKKEIFTDIHPTIVTKLIENTDAVIKNINLELNDNSAFYNNFTNFNVNNNKVSSILNDRMIAHTFGITKNLDNNINLSLLGAYYNSYQEFETDAKYTSDNYLIGVNINKNFKNVSLSSMMTFTKNYNQGERKIKVKEISKVKNNADILSLMTTFKVNLLENLKLFLSHKLDRVSVYGFEEDNQSSLKLRYLDTIMYKNSINFGIDSNININKFTINNLLAMNVNFDVKNNLKTSLGNVKFNSTGQDLNRFLIEYRLGVKYRIDDKISISTKAYINTAKKIGTSISFDVIY